MKAPHLKTGKDAETGALNYLKSRGLRLVESNYRCRAGEIDLVMFQGADLVFIEVRYRRDQRFGGALQSIGPRKITRIKRTAESWLLANPECDFDGCRFDVVAVTGIGPSLEYQWVRDAFQ